MGIELPPESYLAASPGVVVVVEVTGADRKEATQGNPPLVTFRVLEVLNGDLRVGDVIHAIWESWNDPFYAMRGGGDEYARWHAQPLPVPREGDRWIVTGTPVEPAETAPPTNANQPDPMQPRPPFSDGLSRAVLPAKGAFQIPRNGRVPASSEARERILAARSR